MDTIGTTRVSVIVRAKHGDARDLVRTYGPLAFAVARKFGADHHSAEDLAQEAMLQLLRVLPTFEYDRSKGTFRGFIRRIVINRAIDFGRRPPLPTVDAPPAVCAEARDPDAVFDREWEKAHLLEALERVRAEVASTTFHAFQLSVLRGWPPERIAEALGITRNQVAQNKRRVTQRLASIIEELTHERG